jgi:hypothetical protein
MIKQLLSLKLSLCFLLAGLSVSAQTTYVRRVGSTSSDFGLSCAPTADGGTILALESSSNGLDLLSGLAKYDANGNMQWYSQYRVGDFTYPFSVRATDEGYIVFAIGSDSAYVNNNKHFVVLYKTDNLGATVWNKQYNFSGNDLPLNLVNRKLGGFLGFTLSDYNLGVYPKTTVTRFDDFGNEIWSKQYTAPYGLTGWKGAELPNGKICFIATTGDPNNSFFLDVVVTLLDSAGNMLWSKNIGTYYDDDPYAIAVNSSNEIFVTGRGYFMNSNYDSFVLKLDQNGNLLGTKCYDAGTQDGEIMRCILALDDGSLRLLGDMGTFSERDMVMLNVDSNLNITAAHQYTFSPLFTNYPYEMFKAADGGIVFTGDYRPPSTYRDAILTKTENDGSLPCFTTSPVFTAQNVAFHDSVYALMAVTFTTSVLNFPDTVPNNPFFDHMVCAITTGINEGVNPVMVIYPNPATDFIRIDIPQSSEASVQIFGVDGKIVYEHPEAPGRCTIDLNDMATGIYTVRISTAESVQVGTFVKE